MPLAPAIATVRDSSALGLVVIISFFCIIISLLDNLATLYMMPSLWESFNHPSKEILAVLYFLSMATNLGANRIAERKRRDRQARQAQIIGAARRIAELEGWSNVTVRRLADEISYSQPVLYAHFGSREGILAAVAIEGFRELGLALEKARKRVTRGNTVESVAAAYLKFAASAPALYEVMFSLNLSVTFGDPGGATPPELHFAFSQVLALFHAQSSKPELMTELFWASLHGIAELSRTKRFPPSRQKERVKTIVALFSFPREVR